MDSPWATLCFVLSFVSVFALAPVVYAAMSVSDRLVRRQFTFHREDWEKDGKPWGSYWRPPGSVTTGGQGWLNRAAGGSAHWGQNYAWLFKTPEWVRRDREALRLLSRLRVLMLVYLTGILGVFFFFFLGVAVNLAAQLT